MKTAATTNKHRTVYFNYRESSILKGFRVKKKSQWTELKKTELCWHK